MKFTGEIRVSAPRQAIFDALRDPHFFASCIEGVHELSAIDDTRYAAVLETKVAYIRLKFNVVVQLARVEPPHCIEATVEGTPLGVVGRLKATSLTTFVEEPGGTRIDYAIEAALTGKLGAIGQPVIRAKAKEMEQQFVARIRGAFEAPARTQNA